MIYQTSLKSPTKAEVEGYIVKAHQMRSDYISRSIKAGFARVLGLFLNKASTIKTKA
jgi:hypothetical protein